MKIVKKKLSELKRPERNARMHTDKQLVEFRRSVQMFGQIRPIVVDENNVMLAGNGLYDTLLSLNYAEADCIVVSDLSENEKKKLMLADNRIFDLGVDDMAAFDAIIAELGDDLDVPGYDEDLLKTILADSDDVDDIISSYGLVDDDKIKEISSAVDTYHRQEEQFSKESEEIIPHAQDKIESSPANAVDVSDEKTEPIRRYITCPHCGEKIWL